jgi:hypothetical protein
MDCDVYMRPERMVETGKFFFTLICQIVPHPFHVQVFIFLASRGRFDSRISPGKSIGCTHQSCISRKYCNSTTDVYIFQDLAGHYGPFRHFTQAARLPVCALNLRQAPVKRRAPQEASVLRNQDVSPCRKTLP